MNLIFNVLLFSLLQSAIIRKDSSKNLGLLDTEEPALKQTPPKKRKGQSKLFEEFDDLNSKSPPEKPASNSEKEEFESIYERTLKDIDADIAKLTVTTNTNKLEKQKRKLEEEEQRERELLKQSKNRLKNLKKSYEKAQKKAKARALKDKLLYEFNHLGSKPQVRKLKGIYRKSGIDLNDLSVSDLRFVIKNSRKLLKFFKKQAKEAAETNPPYEANALSPQQPPSNLITNQFYPSTGVPQQMVNPQQLGSDPRQLEMLNQMSAQARAQGLTTMYPQQGQR